MLHRYLVLISLFLCCAHASASTNASYATRTIVGWTVHTEVENMVAAGMTPAQVLAAATRIGAEILALDDLGVLAPGKSADFVVLDANPLDDITNTRRIAQVYLRGVAVDRARLRARWTGAGATNQAREPRRPLRRAVGGRIVRA